jgi:hypothetical protein
MCSSNERGASGVVGDGTRGRYIPKMKLREKAVVVAVVGLVIILAMVLVSGLLLGHPPGNAPNNIITTGGA